MDIGPKLQHQQTKRIQSNSIQYDSIYIAYGCIAVEKNLLGDSAIFLYIL